MILSIEFRILSKDRYGFSSVMPSLAPSDGEKFVPCTEVGLRVISSMKMYRMFLHGNTGGSIFIS